MIAWTETVLTADPMSGSELFDHGFTSTSKERDMGNIHGTYIPPLDAFE